MYPLNIDGNDGEVGDGTDADGDDVAEDSGRSGRGLIHVEVPLA